MPAAIEDHALIGDCQTAALVDRDASVDWMCMPRFDSGACFAALLGTPENGYWRLRPSGEVREQHRRYEPETLVLETVFETDSGTVAVIDFMPIRNEVPDLVRIVEGRAGTVAMRSDLVIRHDTGRTIPWVEHTEDGLLSIAGPNAIRLVGDAAMHGEDDHSLAEFEVAAGERKAFVMTWFPSHETEPEPPHLDPHEALQRTRNWWRNWSRTCAFEGEHREAVLRSLITLKALVYAPTGGLIAAPTTSLPESIGGRRNWDYRFCWLRDAAFTLNALLESGYTEEACAWRDWLLRAVAGKGSQVQPLYGVAGERALHEIEADWLPGYRDSRPVRLGNDAFRQMQLDVYGEVMDLMHVARRSGIPPDGRSWALQDELLDHLEKHWRDPDRGIWEVRGEPRPFVHSKVMAWVAADRALKAVENHGLPGPADRWRKLRRDVHNEVCREGFDPKLNTFTEWYGSESLDASLLRIPLVGFLPVDDERVQGTIAAIERELMHDGFVSRYLVGTSADPMPESEGAFLLCTCWLADCHALSGRDERARELFERVLSVRNDVGLLAEEYDPAAGHLLGNFPQAFSHLAVVNTAAHLARGPGAPQPRSEG